MTRIKYPRTFHLPYSETITDDDKRLQNDDMFVKCCMDVVVTEKMDGENTTVYSDGYIHSRSIDGNRNPWQTWLKKYVATWCYSIPIGWRICGENLYPRHSIAYKFTDEKDFFQVFAIYDNKNQCLPWDETVIMCHNLGIKHVEPIYCGPYSKDVIVNRFAEYKKLHSDREVEGFVVRNRNSFHYDDFSKNVAKYVRRNHVTTDEHWTRQWIPNELVKLR